MAENLIIALIGATTALFGVILGIIGQLIGSKIEHNRRVEFLVSETFFKSRLIYLERLATQIENFVERDTQILTLINNVGNSIISGPVKLGKITSSKVKGILIKLIKEMDKKELENLKPAGKSLYFSDNSIFINKLNKFIFEHIDIIVNLREFLNKDLKDIEIKNLINVKIQQNLLNAQDLLKEIRKELIQPSPIS